MDNIQKNDKKQPFNKREWRKKRYSNQHKVKQWEERRQKAVMRSYFKEVNKDKTNIKRNDENTQLQTKKKVNAYQAAQNEFKRLHEETEKKHEEIKRRKEEMKEALDKYHKIKLDRFKKISKKTKRGQPVMKDRMQMLYEKVQNIVK